MTITWRSQRRSHSMHDAPRGSARAAAIGDRHECLDRRSVPRRLPASCLAAVTLLIAFALAAAIAPSAARAATYNTWTAQTPGVNVTWYGDSFTDANNGWLVGGTGNVRHTTNGGTTWAAQTLTPTTTQSLRSVSFVGALNGWAVGGGGVVYHTTNGGTTWASQTSGVTTTIYGVSFVDANNGWFCTTNGVVRHTTNGGTAWTAQTTGITTTIYGVWFTDANNGWLITTGGGVRHTTNGGTTWTAQTSGSTQQLRGVYFLNSQVGWVTGNAGAISHTTNGGTTWTAQTSGTTQTLYDAYATDANNAWAVGGAGVIYHTTNTGTTWAAQTSGTTQAQRGITGAGGSLWACGAGGTGRTYLIDATPPVTTASGLQAGATTGWQTSGQTVTLAASDAQSGVSATYYKVDGGAQQTYSAPFSVSTQGSHAVVYWSVDKGGNIETSHTGYVNIDATPPTTTATGLQGANNTGWQTAGQTVTLTATDAVSGVSTTNYQMDGGATQLYGGPFVVSASGTHTLVYWSTDNAGNAETKKQGYVNIDTSAPTTTATGLQPTATTGWQNVSQVVSLAANDALSGVATTYYTIDSGTRQTYTSAFAMTTQGSHKVTYWSVDAVGNSETPARVGYVNIDTTVPTVSDNSDGAWHNKPVTVTLTPTDTGGSGLASTQYKLQGASSWSTATGNQIAVPAPSDHSGDGVHVYQYRALDNAGNSSAIGNCTVWIDTTPPTTTPVGLAADDLLGWRTTSQTVSLTADDGMGSGVAVITYTVDGGAPQTYSAPFTVTVAGQHPVTYYATDAAGNIESVRTGWVNISNPYAQATANLAPDGQSDWQDQATTVTISGAGDHAPISVSYGIDGATPQKAASNPAQFTVSTEGSHSVAFFATNGLGLDSIHESGYVNIDLSGPVTTATGLQGTNNNGWQTGAQTVTLHATDNLSGLSTTCYTVDGGSTQLYAGPFLVSGDGSHAVTYWSVDVAGNVEPHGVMHNTGFVNIDGTPPTTTATNLQADQHSGWTASGQSVTLNATDTGSGMSGGAAATYYTIDGGTTQTYGAPISVAGAGSHTIVYWSVDEVGNVEQHDATHDTGFVNIDGTPPTTTATGLQADGRTGWVTSTTPVNVSLAASDATSGMSGGSAATYYTIDGGSTQTYGAPFTVSGEGSHAIVYWSIDAAGNVEAHDATHTTGYVNIDPTPPTTTATNLQTRPTTGWTKVTQVSVTLSTSDATSGMSGGSAATYYTIDGGSTQTYGAPFTVSGEGSHAIVYWSVDAAGNVEAHDATHNTGYVNIDRTAPATTATGLQTSATAGWQNTSQLVSLATTDALSGTAATYYQLDSQSAQPYSNAFGVSGQGSHKVTYWSVDAAGNVEAPANIGYVNIDSTAPTVSNGTDSAWHNAPVVVTLTATDTGGSGVAKTQYRLQGSSTWLDASGNQFTVPAPSDGSNDGTHTYDYQALDNAGNSSYTVASTCTVKIDTQGPVVTPTNLAADDLSGWTGTSPQTVGLAAADVGSGTNQILYEVDGATTPSVYGGTFSVSGTGSHPVVYWATDKLGNATIKKTGYVNISDPFVQASPNLAPNANSFWHNTAQTVTITGTGTYPAVVVHYRVDNGTWVTAPANPASVPVISTQGSHSVDFYAVDSHGVQSVPQTGYINIDLAKPATTASGLQASATTGWQTTPQTVTLTPSDTGGSGVASTTYTIDGGAATPYAAPFAISANGSHTVTYSSTDAAGNAESPAKVGYVNIDTQAPVTTASGLQANDHTGWVTTATPVNVTLTPTDTGSGVSGGLAACYYTVDGGDPQSYTPPNTTFQVSGDGQHLVTYWSVDALGNLEATNQGYVNIDTAPPVTTASGLVASASTGWQNTAPSVTLTANDAVSGASTTYYTIDAGAPQTYTAPIAVTTEGSHHLTYWSVDAAGNTETPAGSGYANFDKTDPTVGDNAGTAWHNGQVVVTLTPGDPGGSGVATTQYRLQGTQTWLTATGNAFTVAAPADHSNDGAHGYDYQAIDNAGNLSSIGQCTVDIDTRMPATSALGLQADNHSGWRNTTQTVTLSADDGSGSGVSSTSYKLNGGTTQAYTTPFTVSAAGPTAVSYWSLDGAGNTEAPAKVGYVNIDQTLPTVTDNSDAAWHNSDVVVQLTPADAGGSGVAGTQYRPTGAQGWQTATDNAFTVPAPGSGANDGVHTFDYQVTDNAGNPSTTGTCTVRVDTQPPQTTTSDLQPNGTTGWQTSSQVVHLSSIDAGSGVAATYYRLDSGSRQTYAGPFTVSGSGSHSVIYWSVDKLGNTETPTKGYVNIDTVPPVTTPTGLTATSTSGWMNTAQQVSLTPSDGLSGVAATYYTLDGGSQQTYTAPFTIGADGQHTVTYWSVDNAGNTESPAKIGYVNIDTTAPTMSDPGLAPDAFSDWRSTSQTVTLSASDGTGAVSGLQSITYSLDGSGPLAYSAAFTVSGDGQHVITYYATDKAGNDSVHTTGYVNISDPYAQSSGLSGDARSDWHTGTAQATISAGGDNGPFTIYYSIDGGQQQSAAAPLTITESTDGSHEIDYYAKNSVGVTGVPQTCFLNVDQTPPATATQGLQASSSTGWTATSPQTVTLSPSDLTSGMSGGAAVTYYRLDGGASQIYGGPFQVSGDGSHTVEYWSVDAAGNVEQHGGLNNANVGYVNIDATPPTVSDDADSAWHNSQVAVTVNAADGANGSGVASVEYRAQGSSTWTTVSGAQATISVAAPADGSNDGMHAFDYQATDGAGNTSTIGHCTVKVDTQGPVVTTNADAYWHNSAVTVHLQATDAGSGVAQVSYQPQGASTWTTVPAAQADVAVAAPTDGLPHSYTYHYVATDALGNASAVGSFTVNMDTRMPNTTVHGLPTGWVNHAVSLTFTATPGDGATIARTEYSLNAGVSWNPIAVGTALTFKTAGQATVLYRSVNSAGTTEDPPRTAIVRIDLSRPACYATKNASVVRNRYVKLGYRVNDKGGCGYAKVRITIYLKKKVVKRITILKAATNRSLTYRFKVTLKRNKYTWKVSATDIAGNVQTRIGSRTLTVR